jgi:tetratricopeptide (TPR) repeat protein
MNSYVTSFAGHLLTGIALVASFLAFPALATPEDPFAVQLGRPPAARTEIRRDPYGIQLDREWGTGGRDLPNLTDADRRTLGLDNDVLGEEHYQNAMERLRTLVKEIHAMLTDGNPEQARLAAEQAILQYGELSTLRFLTSLAAMQTGAYEDAIDSWALLARDRPDELPVLLPWSEALIRVGRLEEAATVLEKAFAIDAYHTRALFNQFILELLNRRRAEAGYIPLKMSGPDLGSVAGWLASETGLGGLLPDPDFAFAAQMILAGGSAVDPDEASGDSIPPISEDGFLRVVGSEDRSAPAPAEAAPAREQVRAILDRTRLVISRFGDLIQAENWSMAMQLGRHPGMARLGFTAPAFMSFVEYAAHRSGDEQGRRRVRRLARQNPDHLHARLRWVQLLLEAEDYTAAVQHLLDVDRRFPGHLLTRLMLASAWAESGNNEQALAVLESIPSQYVGFMRYWMSLGEAYQQTILTSPAFDIWRARIR